MPGCKKNPLHVTIACLHEVYYFWCVLAMSIYWRAIPYAGWECGACAPLRSCVFSALFCTTTHWSISFLLFVCDNNISYVVTFAIKNIWTKAHQCLFSNLQKLWPTFLFIANLILLANTPTPDVAQYHFEQNLTASGICC